MNENYTPRTILGEPPYQILSMDGGGIYGLVTAGLLRRLCQRDEEFLAPAYVEHHSQRDEKNRDLGRKYVFAGTSAGAINGLLLASQKNPRKFVLEGKLERFWSDPRVYSNSANPMHAWTSLMGLTGWLGFEDFKDLLYETFGETTLEELHHNVLVTVFNFAGVIDPGTHVRQWTPESFVNFGHRAAPNMLVADLAYASAAPPSLRAIQGGLGDGGIFSPNPSDNALAEVLSVMTRREEGLSVCASLLKENDNQTHDDPAKIALLSVGVGYCAPHYSLFDFDFGVLPFSLFPTNLQDARYLPAPLTMGLDASSRIAEERTSLLLGANFHRLNPPLLQPPAFPPVLVATALCRFDPWREYFVAEINKALETKRAKLYLDRAERFVSGWQWRVPAMAEFIDIEESD